MKLISLVVLVFSLSATAAEVRMSPDAYLQINSDQIGLYNVVQSNILAHAGFSTIYPQKFEVQKDVPSPDNEVCKALGTTEVHTSLLFRDPNGLLHSAHHIVCDGAGKEANVVAKLIPGSNAIISESNFRKDVYSTKMNNDAECGTNKTETQQVCAPAGYNVFDAVIPDNAEKSSGSFASKIEPDPKKSNCVLVTYTMAGKGLDFPYIKGGPCHEGTFYRYSINMSWTSNQAIPRQ